MNEDNDIEPTYHHEIREEDRALHEELRNQIIIKFPVLQYFTYDHLPAEPSPLRQISKMFYELAEELIDKYYLTKNDAEFAVALRKLLEAKDAAVRSTIGYRGTN